jgi:hypothetical protein
MTKPVPIFDLQVPPSRRFSGPAGTKVPLLVGLPEFSCAYAMTRVWSSRRALSHVQHLVAAEHVLDEVRAQVQFVRHGRRMLRR